LTSELATNVLYYGDNLDILPRYLPDAAVDLVYLDPPFNSNRDDNVIFRDESGNATDAQLLAFARLLSCSSRSARAFASPRSSASGRSVPRPAAPRGGGGLPTGSAQWLICAHEA
jgi:hypothetical protein